MSSNAVDVPVPSVSLPDPQPNDAPADTALDSIREVQREWMTIPVGRRLEHIAVLRDELVERSRDLAPAVAKARNTTESEVLTSEIIPLADALGYLEKNAVKVLEARKVGKEGSPQWLKGVKTVVERSPYGIVLVIAPSNYPLYLAAVQSIQALVAGNAVVIKPAPGCSPVLELWDELLAGAGFPEGLHHVLLEDPQNAMDAIDAGIDKVVLTGGERAGQAVLTACARNVTPSVVELSGIDSMYVRHDADLKLVRRALAFGLSANHGQTCIAPRRILVHHQRIAEFRELLQEMPLAAEPAKVSPEVAEILMTSLDSGAMPLCGEWNDADSTLRYPFILDGVQDSSPLWKQDLFGPMAVVRSVAGDQEALEFDRKCPYALGASIFSNDLKEARKLGASIPAPIVTVNDLIAPTADPRLPFGGCKRSGFGVTRGPEGLLEMTYPRVVAVRRPRSWMPHLKEDSGGIGPEMFYQLLRMSHCRGLISRIKALFQMIKHSRPPKA